MKQKILFAILFTAMLFTACKEEILAPDISGIETSDYLLNIGDKITLAPSVKNLKGNNYEWTLNGKKIADATTNYTFVATQPGMFVVIFKASNKGGAADEAFKIEVEAPIEISFDKPIYTTSKSNVLEITPKITGPERNDYKYEWMLYDAVIGKEKNIDFIEVNPGDYELKLTVSAGKQSVTTTTFVKVEEADYKQSAYTLLEYYPAPANGLDWSLIGGETMWNRNEFPLAYNDFINKATEIRKGSPANGIHLGSWGGYATFEFDHTVANIKGKTDLEISAKFSQFDLPQVFVAYDKNKNGKPDEDEWYEIKNHDWGKEDMANYEITFTYDRVETDEMSLNTYFEWKDNQAEQQLGEVHYSKRLSSSITNSGDVSTKGFFPGYFMIDKERKEVIKLDGWPSVITRKGKRITRDVTGGNSFNQKLNIDIDDAVNEKGERVSLIGINFVRVRKIVYPFEKNFSVTPQVVEDANMKEGRILYVGQILDKHI